MELANEAKFFSIVVVVDKQHCLLYFCQKQSIKTKNRLVYNSFEI